MRKDMKKILVGRPRIGSFQKNFEVRDLRRLKPSEEDNAPMRLSMKPKGAIWWDDPFDPRGLKILNENFAPLKRFLHSKIGQPWDRVYREIRRFNPPDSAVSKHIYDHLYEFVDLHPRYVNGELDIPYHSPFGNLHCHLYCYVDREGVLRATPTPKYESLRRKKIVLHRNKPYELRELKQGKETIRLLFRREDQVWFSAEPFRTLSKKEKKRYKLAS